MNDHRVIALVGVKHDIMNDSKAKLVGYKIKSKTLFVEVIAMNQTQAQRHWNIIVKQEDFEKGVKGINSSVLPWCTQHKDYKEGEIAYSEPKIFVHYNQSLTEFDDANEKFFKNSGQTL